MSRAGAPVVSLDGRPAAPAAVAPADAAGAAVLAAGLTKRYGPRVGCADVHLRVPEGAVFGLLGPNGAGKSTLVRLLLGLLRPDAGTALLFGRPAGDPASRFSVGYLPELFRFPDWLTAREVLTYHGRLAGLDAEEAARQADRLLERVGLGERAGGRVGSFSKGMQQRLGLACALMGRPRLVFLDEPTSALDPIGRRHVRELIRELRREGVTVFLNSHLLADVQEVCDHVAIMRGGRVVAEGPLERLLAPQAEVELTLADPEGRASEVLAAAGRPAGPPQPLEAEVPGAAGRVRWRLRLDPGVEVPELVARLVAAGVEVHAVAPGRRDLEALFLTLAGEGGEP